MAAFALPELLPNKWRHIGVVIADFTVYIAVIVAPVTARYGYEFGTWAWNFWAVAIFQGLSFLGLLFLYHPPKHPYVALTNTSTNLLANTYIPALESPTSELSSL